jgi:hypothetical protein
MIDQVCWNEMNVDGELTLQCVDAECRQYEQSLRQTLFRWHHFPVDMVVEPFVAVRKAVHNTGFGIQVAEETAAIDPTNDVQAHRYENQFRSMDDVEKIRTPQVTHDAAATARRLLRAHELFDGVLEVRLTGVDVYLSLWDPLATWMGVEPALYAMVDQPELIHAILARMTDGYLWMLDRLQEGGLLAGPQSLIHCTGAWTDELPADGFDPARPRTQDMWMYGLAQMLGTVSPEMFREFEVGYTRRLCERFGLVYYGCCDPLDRKMNEVRMLPNVRKVSMSPWVDQQRGAAEIGRDYIFSRKPNPALLAANTFDGEAVRGDLLATRNICQRNGCGLELILKDLSTVRYQPQRIFEWAKIAMEVAQA